MIPGSSGWTFEVIYNFCAENGCPGGGATSAGLALDKRGNLYGTVAAGGAHGRGGVIELSPNTAGWDEQVLYSFGTRTYDGYLPYDAPTLDSAGNLYATTALGGAYELGNIFKLNHTSAQRTQDVLYQFCSKGGGCKDGAGPEASVVMDTSGNLYGTTHGGGRTCDGVFCGTIFELTKQSDGRWKHRILYGFQRPENGFLPSSGLILDKAGNLYGTTATGGVGGCFDGCGVVYELTPGDSGKWTYTVLHRFHGADGDGPSGMLVLDDKGNLYGSAYSVVFEITP
jgi:hypothetical protein